MALTRALLKALAIEDEKADQIIAAHVETVDGLKAERDSYQAKAEKASDLEKQLKELKDSGAADGDYKEKYDAEHAEFEKYKAEQAAKAATREKRNLYRDLLKKAGVSEKRLDTVLKVTDLNTLQVKDGALVDAEKLETSVKEEWGDFIVSTNTEGANLGNPPAGGMEPTNKLEDLSMSEYIKARKGQ